MNKWITCFSSECVPSAEDMTNLLGEADAIIKSLNVKVKPGSRQSEALHDLKKTYEAAKKSLPLDTTQGVDKGPWGNLTREERVSHFTDVFSLKKALMGLDYPDIRAGFNTFLILALTLLISVMAYLILHMNYYTSPEKPTEESSKKSATPNANGVDRTIEFYEQLTILRLHFNKPPTDVDWSEVRNSYNSLSDELIKERLSFRTKKLLGSLNGAISQQDVEVGKELLSSLETSVAEDIEDPPSNFLWTRGPGKWVEFAFWAFFGVLVGLMYYVSMCLKVGLFNRQDCTTMTAEVLMAPIVACVVFFLLSKTDITEISAAGESIFVVLGFAFLLGYAVRRTVGILDNLKKRLLPDP